MYVVGREGTPAVVTLELPSGWKAVSGLAKSPAYTFRARSASELVDSPIMVGRFARYSFTIANVPHQIAWWDTAGHATVDASVARTLESLAREAHQVFDAFPYRSFAFLIVGDVGNGGLEHRSSVSLAAPAGSTSVAAADFTEEAAHEYFHAWNEMALRPNGWGGLSHAAASPNRLTWWMEGATMYYADLISRRAHAPIRLDDRRAQLESWLSDYLDNPGNVRISPESASVTANMPPGANGNFAPDVYAQGRLIAAALDLYIRGHTSDQRSLDDAMRVLYRRRADSGYSAVDVARAVGTVCNCDAERFLARYVRSAHPVYLNDGLARLGWRLTVRNMIARDPTGAPLPDTRVFAYASAADSSPRVLIIQPEGAWARAGLRTGDVLVRINGDSVATPSDFRRVVRGARVGDTARVEYVRAGARAVASVKITAYERAEARISELPHASSAQVERRRRFQSP
jgi:predicted metalloprotease with PDZ domain